MKTSALIMFVCAAAYAETPQEAILRMLATPIAFYGIVTDESGNVVSDAKIRFGIAAETSRYHDTTSDLRGRFELLGEKGLDLSVWVSKEGYYTTDESRGRHFVYGGGRGKDTASNPTPESPAVFVLRKMGETSPLVYVARKSIRVPKDRTPVELDLTSGEVVPAGKGHLKIEIWTANQGMDPNKNEPYAWEARIQVVGGGLQGRVGKYDFQAPESGYSPVFETGMTKTTHPWREGFAKEFFAKLGNGQFARFLLELRSGGDHFVVLESHLNPTTGARNLEFDPKKLIPAAR